MDIETLKQSLLIFIALILSITLHEFGHAWMANKRGDSLPKLQGRVTLNPLAHIDPLGTLILPGIMILGPVFFGGMPFAIFGWGKPVQISLQEKDPQKRKIDDILITLSGPSVNLILATLSTIGIIIAVKMALPINLIEFLAQVLFLNVVLTIFNLLPIPPLDGSRVFFYLVKMREETFSKIARNSWWILLLAINIPSPSNSLLSMIMHPLINAGAFPFFYILSIFGIK